jgi:hypothetical protein
MKTQDLMLVFLIAALKKFTLQKIKHFLNFLSNHFLKKVKEIKMMISKTLLLTIKIMARKKIYLTF